MNIKQKVFILFAILFIIFILLIAYACCVVAGRADELYNELFHKKFDEDDLTEENKNVADKNKK